MLQRSISEAYRERNAPRHVRYSVTRNEGETIPPNAPEYVRAMLEGRRDFKISVNFNEDGSPKTDEQGNLLGARIPQRALSKSMI